MHSEGYRYIRQKFAHPFASNGYVFEHRLVMEDRMRREVPDHKFLVEIDGKRYLRREIQVHHRNESRVDNCPDNLLAMTGNAHKIVHLGGTPAPDTYWPIPSDGTFLRT